MKHVIVVGAGIGGLGSALALARAGHQVTLLERDHTPMPEDPEGAFRWDRRGAPQVQHSHVLLARLRLLLLTRFPDVLEAMHAAGVEDRPMLDGEWPETMDDTSPREGDEELVLLAGRRTTFEWVLRRCVMDEDHVELRDGVGVSGLLVEDGAERSRVVGVRTDRGELRADVVVVANGRRSDVPGWAAAVGVEIAEEIEESGITYLSRFYRRTPGVPRPEGPGFGTADLGYLKAGLFPCDGDTISITLAVPVEDVEMRRMLADPDVFHRAARSLPTLAPWLQDGHVDPISDVNFMAGLLNRQRRFTDPEGQPLLPGLFVVGDAHTCTNPLYGRGCSLALVGAVATADALRVHPDDPVAAGAAYEATVAREVAPWYTSSVMQDRMAKANGSEMDRSGGAFGPALATAMRTDSTLLRAFLRMLNLLSTPDSLFTNPDLLVRLQAAGAREPVEIDMGPADRGEFLVAIDAT